MPFGSKKEIRDLPLQELEKAMAGMNEPPYRARQIFFWLYQRGVCDFKEMSNLPGSLLEKLDQRYFIVQPDPREHRQSADGTEKFLFKLRDAQFIETVLIPAARRKTVCISTQVGCKLACTFCASGKNGYIRNLAPSEILNQILYLQQTLKHKITNVVFMGMGEPLDNYENVAKAVTIMNDAKGMNIGARRITVSTSGIIPGIKKLKELGLQVNLAVSLHAVSDKLRNALMPINKRYPLEELIRACEEFKGKTGRMMTLEYVLLKGINDSPEDADGLAAIAKRLKVKVNLIPYSEVPEFDFRRPERERIRSFMKRLARRGTKATLRESKGKDIQAACGQLAGKISKHLETMS